MGEYAIHLKALHDIMEERQRQLMLGWTPDHDNTHADFGLSRAAAAFAMLPAAEHKLARNGESGALFEAIDYAWPWAGEPKSKGDRVNLVRAAALLVAEIERIDRATESEAS